MKLKVQYLYLILIVCCGIIPACKKSETPIPPVMILSIDPALVTLAKDEFFISTLKVIFQNAAIDENLTVVWSSENPRIARVTEDGTVWPEGAGETFVVVTMVNGKGVAKCKVIITDRNDYKYRLVLKDKGHSDLSLNNPQAFLSAKAIERRRKDNIPIDETDLPISPEYLKRIQQIGGTIVAKSKWLNIVSVNCTDQFLIDKYRELPFVKDVIMVGQGKKAIVSSNKQYVDIPQKGLNETDNSPLDYGAAHTNIEINNGQALHNQGFKGDGIDIAVIDAGFINLKANPSFKNVNIKGAKSFVFENDDPYSIDSHGVWVTSCMATNRPGHYVGTAPEANYWLLRTEDESSEYPIEEDYWVNAIEYADSVGVDIVNSSLYYDIDFSISSYNYKFENMDGKTALASRSANIAASKGILIVNCAGNRQSWVGSPADSPNVLTVGSVSSRLTVDYFSSWGVTIDGRMKPDVMALGGGAAVINIDGDSENRMGTSYSSPIICGLAACLWQAYPKLTNLEIIDVIRKSGDHAANPVVPYGYGIPDMQKAMDICRNLTASR